VRVVNRPFHLDLGCSEPESEDSVGGHLVAVVEDAFLVTPPSARLGMSIPRSTCHLSSLER